MKISSLRKWAAIAAALWLPSMAATGLAQKVTDFTADQVTMAADGKTVAQSKVYFSGGNMRLDNAMPQSGANLVMIFRSDLKKNFMLNADRKAFFEREFDEDEMAGAMQSMGPVKNRREKTVGEETVSGYRCVKKEIEADIEVLGYKQTARSVVWQSPQFDLPLRTGAGDGHVTELRNIKAEKPAAAVFEVPVGYSRVSDMMQLLGDERSGGGRPSKPARQGKEGGSTVPPALPPGFKLPPGLKLPPPQP